MTAFMVLAPSSSFSSLWSLVFMLPLFLIVFAPQAVRFSWKRVAGCLAAIVAVTALSTGIICYPCERCDPWWLQFGICIPR